MIAVKCLRLEIGEMRLRRRFVYVQTACLTVTKSNAYPINQNFPD
jgi:hypothetical protein